MRTPVGRLKDAARVSFSRASESQGVGGNLETRLPNAGREVSLCSFIVRITCERTGPQSEERIYRGSIEAVGSGRRLYFHKLENILAFIREQAGGEPQT